ncbi:hypothetical protein [Vibrio harveyi]|uniref:hypothetical protein n=1 Tax=Vibrio harveyi TaxID=669 RepID=UPI003CE8971C
MNKNTFIGLIPDQDFQIVKEQGKNAEYKPILELRLQDESDSEQLVSFDCSRRQFESLKYCMVNNKLASLTLTQNKNAITGYDLTLIQFDKTQMVTNECPIQRLLNTLKSIFSGR